MGGAGILRVREAADAGRGADLEHIVRLRGDLDVLAQLGDLGSQIALGRDEEVQIGAADTFREVLGRSDRLLDAQQVGLPIHRRHADLLREDRLRLRKQPRLRFVAVREPSRRQASPRRQRPQATPMASHLRCQTE
jgi:hypothetical protein